MVRRIPGGGGYPAEIKGERLIVEENPCLLCLEVIECAPSHLSPKVRKECVKGHRRSEGAGDLFTFGAILIALFR